jgi:hypothetical protein
MDASAVSIPYWLGSKLRAPGLAATAVAGLTFQSPIGWGLSCESCAWRTGILFVATFQSPIGWGLSCESKATAYHGQYVIVSIPYWLGSKLRDTGHCLIRVCSFGFNPLLVGV